MNPTKNCKLNHCEKIAGIIQLGFYLMMFHKCFKETPVNNQHYCTCFQYIRWC